MDDKLLFEAGYTAGYDAFQKVASNLKGNYIPPKVRRSAYKNKNTEKAVKKLLTAKNIDKALGALKSGKGIAMGSSAGIAAAGKVIHGIQERSAKKQVAKALKHGLGYGAGGLALAALLAKGLSGPSSSTKGGGLYDD